MAFKITRLDPGQEQEGPRVRQEKRKALLIDVQKYEGGKNYYPRARARGATKLSMARPALRNRLVYQGGSGPQHPDLDLYIDETKAPFKKC